jgi:two-component system, OmpR family, sensor kinase
MRGRVPDPTQASRSPQGSPAAFSRHARLREEFVSTACHELRTPLTALHATLELLREELRSGADDPQQAAAYADAALRQTRRLIGVANDLLDLGRLDADAPVELRPVDLGEIAHELGEDFAARLAAAGRALRIDGTSVLALADRAAVARILLTLMDNAATYGAGPVTVTLVGDAGQATVAVADDGPGVEPAERERIFGRFTRGSAAENAPAGAGLGLPIARGLARAMGGDLEAVAAPRGARFVLTLRGAASAEG